MTMAFVSLISRLHRPFLAACVATSLSGAVAVGCTMDESDNESAVVSKATANPAVTSLNEEVSCSGLPATWAMANVMPTTVPKKPRIGTAQLTFLTRPMLSSARLNAWSARYFK